jgi:hypothetical protein
MTSHQHSYLYPQVSSIVVLFVFDRAERAYHWLSKRNIDHYSRWPVHECDLDSPRCEESNAREQYSTDESILAPIPLRESPDRLREPTNGSHLDVRRRKLAIDEKTSKHTSAPIASGASITSLCLTSNMISRNRKCCLNKTNSRLLEEMSMCARERETCLKSKRTVANVNKHSS